MVFVLKIVGFIDGVICFIVDFGYFFVFLSYGFDFKVV